MSSVAILGLGLIGGSLARDLAAAGMDVIGYDRARESLRAAKASGVLTDVLGPDLQGLEDIDYVILAVPVNAAPRLLEQAAPRMQSTLLIMDVGSTKRMICAQAEALDLGARFVGAHPFAGDHRSGWIASRSGLFADTRIFLCPVRGTRAAVLERAHALWRRVGGRPEVIDAATHDERLAWSSQLPQLASSALALALASAGLPHRELGSGGRDATRLAGSDPELWTGVVMENAEHASRALAALEQHVADLRTHIEARNEAGVRAAFGRALRWSYTENGS